MRIFFLIHICLTMKNCQNTIFKATPSQHNISVTPPLCTMKTVDICVIRLLMLNFIPLFYHFLCFFTVVSDTLSIPTKKISKSMSDYKVLLYEIGVCATWQNPRPVKKISSDKHCMQYDLNQSLKLNVTFRPF